MGLEKIMAAVSRHAPKPEKAEDKKSEEYEGLTVEGVEEARKAAWESQKELVDSAPADAVIFIGGSSYEPRTKSTARIYGEELKKIYQDNPEVKVLTEEDLSEYMDESISGGIKKLAEDIKSFGGKIVVTAPMFIKELDYGKGWGYWDEDMTDKLYSDYLLEKYNGDEELAFKEWMETGGSHNEDGVKQGPTPLERAKSFLDGLYRLKKFAVDQIGDDRPIIVNGVGHRWDLDVFITYMATSRVDYEAYKEATGGRLSDENENAVFEIDENGKSHIRYRGKDFVLEREED